MVTIDIEKAFDSVDHTFLLCALRKFGFGNNFIKWVKIILNRQESCIMNNGHSTGYFALSSGTRQGDPISAYLFILVMEVLFVQIRSNKNIRGLKTFDYEIKLTSFADDVTCFLRDLTSIEHLLSLLRYSHQFTSRKIKIKKKSEVCGIGSKKGVLRAFSDLSSVDIENDTVKILGFHHSYNKQLADERNFSNMVTDIHNVLNLWTMRGISLIGKILIFKTLGISKLQYIASMAQVPDKIIQQLKSIQKKFLWKSNTPKIKHSTLIGDYKDGGLKNVDIETKLKALKLTWVRQLCDDNHHPWKIIPLHYLTLPNRDLILHRNFACNQHIIAKLNFLPAFYKDLLSHWSEISHCEVDCIQVILSESLWYNSFIQINQNAIFFRELCLAGINRVADLFEKDGKLVMFHKLRQLGLPDTLHFKWMQLIDAIPEKWKVIVKDHPNNSEGLVSKYSLYWQTESELCTIDISCKSRYDKLLKKIQTQPTSIKYWEEKFGSHLDKINWKEIYLLPRSSPIESYTRAFQYKIINNALFLNKKLFKMGLIDSPTCSFCRLLDESPVHFFCQCGVTVELWSKLQNWLSPHLILPELDLKNALLGYTQSSCKNRITVKLINHIILIFKRSLYEMRSCKVSPSIFYIVNRIRKKCYGYRVSDWQKC